jgi:hypothetical protein
MMPGMGGRPPSGGGRPAGAAGGSGAAPNGESRSGEGSARVYILEDGKPKRVRVTIGATDGRYTEIQPGSIGEGDKVLIGIDPKRVELALWQDRFSDLALGNDPGETITLLDNLHAEITKRTAHLSTTRSATLHPSEQFPWTVLVIDEWAELAAGGSSKERARAEDLLRRYVSLGRAVGCTAILCTQRPTSDVIDVGTRTLLNDRFALRCGDRHQAEAILSAGTFQQGDLIGTSVGRALWSDGGPSRAFQFFEVTDCQVPSLVCPGFG